MGNTNEPALGNTYDPRQIELFYSEKIIIYWTYGDYFMRQAYAFTLCILLHLCILSSIAHSQNRDSGVNYEILISFIKSQFVETKYRTTGMSRSISPQMFKVIDGLTYHIDLTLKVNGEALIWNTPIEVILTLPDGSKHSEIININRSLLYSDKPNEFSFNLDSKRKGWVKIEMNALKNWNNLNVPNVKFIGSSVLLD